MKRKLLKKQICLLVAMIIMMSLAACSAGGQHSQQKNTKEIRNDRQQEEDYVYHTVFQTVKAELDWVREIFMDGNQIVMVGSVYEKTKGEKEERYHTYILTCETGNGEKETSERDEGGGSDRILEVNADSVEKREILLNENAMVHVVYINTAADNEKKIYIVTSGDDEGGIAGGKGNSGEKRSNTGYYLHMVDLQGNILKSCGLNLKANNNFYISTGAAFVTENGYFYTAVDSSLFGFDPEGNQCSVYNFGGQVYGMLPLASGEIFVLGAAVNSGNMWKLLDLETGRFGEIHHINDYKIGSVSLYPGRENEVFLKDSSNLYQFHIDSGEMTVLFSWLTVGIDATFLDFAVDEGMIVAASGKKESTGVYMPELAFLKKEAASKVEKTVLTLCCNDLDDSMKEKILEFNKYQEDYQIECVDYSNYEDAGLQMNLDIVSGKIPDIVCIQNLPFERYMKKGMFTDLYSLMEQDSEVKKEDFIDSVRKAAEVDGKLYYMGDLFDISALVGSRKMIGDRTSWTMEEMEKIYQRLPKDGEFMSGERRQWFLSDYLNAQIMDYVNWQSGEVRFDSEEFQKILEFSKIFPDRSEKVSEKYNRIESIEKGNVLLEAFPLYDFYGIQVFSELYQSVGGFSVVPYPSDKKGGTLRMQFTDTAMAITEQCKDKKGAWQFVRQFLIFEYQKTLNPNDIEGFPTRKDALEKRLEYAQAKKEYTDSDGTIVKPMHAIDKLDGKKIEIGPLKKEEADFIREIIERDATLYHYNSSVKMVFDIVMEEAESYYAGDKTVEEVTEIIQNRVELYVSENS